MRVVILGGGTAGWMAAAALSEYFGRTLAITLIESGAIGTVGVGEATIPQIRLFNSGLKIDERDFLSATRGTIKLGIEFIGWQRAGTRYFHGFGDVGRQIGLVPFHHYWLRHHAQGGAPDIEEFSPNALAAREGRYGAAAGKPARLPASAYHFDAALYAGFLRSYAEARGVARLDATVQGWRLHPETGFVTALEMEGGTAVEGDLFVDCSGFRGVLTEQALETGYEDWSHWLPCDRAMALPSEGRGRLDPFTRSTAREAGWQWEIPLQHRTGNGHVYASGFTDDEAALRTLRANLPGKPLGDPRPLRFLTGKRRRIWNRNVIALGLASGFLEPLESTSIHLIQAGIARLLALFPDRRCDPTLVDEFNRQMDFEFTAIRDFLILHYHLTERDESEFWRYCRAMSIPDSLRDKMDLFRATGRIVRFNTELFDVPSWLQVMLGQGLRPGSWHPMVDAASEVDLHRFIATTAQETRAQVDTLDSHDAWIARVGRQPAQA
ncbi:tryptophan halogenase family protein [Thetidibacter halocola]|uniref:Tryptophan 7-halogenase n=1 Tax=Thetidibacter halocola TaxID=2827239 RepID=A0A8J7WG70_9RHOB|nr:tryptophan halogenase family protein [Thetidibacter halocola]MBS0124703.1 tryptophan 7-halogenase [Thetidibacter halocola]